MSCPVNLQALPSGLLEAVCTPENLRGRTSTMNSLTPLSFPKSRSALWDSSPAGEKLRLQLCAHRKPRLVLLEKAMRLAQRHARHSNKPRLLCFLLGSLSVDADEQGVTVTLDRFDPGRDQAGARVPSALLPGDVLVPCLFSTQAEAGGVVQSEAELHHCFKALQQCVSSRQTLDVSQLIKVRGRVVCSQQSDAASFSLSWSAVCPSSVVEVQPVRAVPVIPTALLRSLTSVHRPPHSTGRQRGFLTMDQTRKLLLLLESDPKASSLPLVGLWLSGVTQVHHPQVWAWCLRFLYSSALQDRVLSERRCFLLVLFGSTHRTPQFFQCRGPEPGPGPGPGPGPQLDYQLLTASQSVTLYQQVVPVEGQTLQCVLGSEDPSRQTEVFREAQTSFSRAAGLSVSDQDSGVEDEDLSPRPSPSPHPPAPQTRRVQPSVPELSLLIDSSFMSNHSGWQEAGSAHRLPPPPPADRKSAPPPRNTSTTSSSAPRPAAPPHLHSTPNSNLQQPCTCCSTPHSYDCTSIFSSPGLGPAAPPAPAASSHHHHHTPPPPSKSHASTPSVPPPSSFPPASPSSRHNTPPPSSLHPAAPPPAASSHHHHHTPPSTIHSSTPSVPPLSSLYPAPPPPSSRHHSPPSSLHPASPSSRHTPPPPSSRHTPPPPSLCHNTPPPSSSHPSPPLSSHLHFPPPSSSHTSSPPPSTCLSAPPPPCACSHHPPPPPPPAAPHPVSPPWLSRPSCVNQCCDQAGGVLPSDTYQLLLHQDRQLRLLQAQVQMLLEAQGKLQTSSQQVEAQTARSTASIAVGTGASLFWGNPVQPSLLHQEAPPSYPTPPPSSSSSSSSCRPPSHADLSVNLPVGGAEDGDITGQEVTCSPPGQHSVSGLQSPVLGESASMYRATDDQSQQRFYHNLMSQLTSRLQESDSKQEDEEEEEEEEFRRRSLSVVSDRSRSSQSSESSRRRRSCGDSVVSATVRQLQQLGVDVDPEDLTESDRVIHQTIESASTLASISPAAVLSRLSVSDPTTSSLFPGGSVDLSLEANAIALRYLSDSQLSRLSLGGHAPQSAVTSTSSSSCASLLSPNNMSLATRKYMRRYGLIEEEDEEEEEVVEARQPLTEALNMKLLPQSQLIRDLRPKMQLLAGGAKANATDKENCSGRRPSLVRASSRQTEGSVGNILDLSRLRQLPKLF
ncbi:SCL-interrupting locus protein homolog [Centropristis striata]|uniref:SCL-interrupting locus protein homolog n=1 Tax=Centropristis striata TaxID=184440 RepID=UPI0027E1478E|nr:SCL-interrupting locus protein homolog [Centropristis striata]